MTSVQGYEISRVIPLEGSSYWPYVTKEIDVATRRVWALIFIIDVRLDKDPELLVRQFIDKLAYAAWRRVDVRVIVGVSTVPDLEVSNTASAYYMAMRGLPVRFYAGPRRRKTHSKYLLIDRDLAVVGSNNWTDRGFRTSNEMSLALSSDGLARRLEEDFLMAWDHAGEVKPYA